MDECSYHETCKFYEDQCNAEYYETCPLNADSVEDYCHECGTTTRKGSTLCAKCGQIIELRKEVESLKKLLEIQSPALPTEQEIRERFKYIIDGKGLLIPRIIVEFAIDDLFKGNQESPAPPTEPGSYRLAIKVDVYDNSKSDIHQQGLWVCFPGGRLKVHIDNIGDGQWFGPIKAPK